MLSFQLPQVLITLNYLTKRELLSCRLGLLSWLLKWLQFWDRWVLWPMFLLVHNHRYFCLWPESDRQVTSMFLVALFPYLLTSLMKFSICKRFVIGIDHTVSVTFFSIQLGVFFKHGKYVDDRCSSLDSLVTTKLTIFPAQVLIVIWKEVLLC